MSEVWPQPYYLFGRGLGFSALLAILPTLLLLYLLAVKRKASWIAALAGLGATMVLAKFAYGMSFEHTVSSTAYGACFGIFPITWIVLWALILYEITVATGKFEVIKDSIGSITSDKRMQALLIAFAFGAFIEGCAGFGTPVAVAAAMMVGLGFSSLYASSICLLANTAPVAFGSIGIPVITLVTSGWPAMLEVWPAVLTCGGVFAVIQFSVSNFIGPQLTDILSSIGAMGALVLLLRFWEPRHTEEHERVTDESMKVPADELPVRAHDVRSGPHYSASELWLAWMPDALLVVFVLAWGYPPITAMLNRASISFAWPGLHNEIF